MAETLGTRASLKIDNTLETKPTSGGFLYWKLDENGNFVSSTTKDGQYQLVDQNTVPSYVSKYLLNTKKENVNRAITGSVPLEFDGYRRVGNIYFDNAGNRYHYVHTPGSDANNPEKEFMMYSDYGASDAIWNASKNIWERPGYTYGLNNWERKINEYGQRWNQETGKYEGLTYGQLNAAKAGMLNAQKQGMTVDERKAWMLGEGKDYLAQLNGGTGIGFDINKYSGSAADNKKLFDAYKGYETWKRLQALSAAESYRNETASYIDGPEKVGKQFANATDRSNRALLGLDAKAALYLNSADFARWLSLQRDQKIDNAARAMSLNFNGKTYSDENAYNAAVGVYNQQLLQNQMQAMSQARGRRGRNAVMNDSKYALASNYQTPSTLILNDSKLAETEYKKQGGLLSYKQYLTR